MKIHVDRKNNRVIAYGSYRGKRIKAIAHCREDFFNEELGIKIAKMKYDILQTKAQKQFHDNYVRELHKNILWSFHEIDAENDVLENLSHKVENKIENYHKFLSENFK